MFIIIGIALISFALWLSYMATKLHDAFYYAFSVLFSMLGLVFIFTLGTSIGLYHEEITIKPLIVEAINDTVIVVFETKNDEIKVLTNNKAQIYNNTNNIVVKATIKVNSYKQVIESLTEYELIINTKTKSTTQ